MTAALQAVVRAAADATGAAAACLLVAQDDDLVVVATAGAAVSSPLGRRLPAAGTTAGFVLSSGQPMALSLGPDDSTSSTLAALIGRPPTAVLSVPCASDDAVVGVLELVDKASGKFTIDDIELVTLLAGIAGVALTDSGTASADVPGPQELGAELGRLAQIDPVRYAAVASAVSLLLSRG